MTLLEQATAITQNGPASGLWVLVSTAVVIALVVCVDSLLRGDDF
jgi:hypothetical protein